MNRAAARDAAVWAVATGVYLAAAGAAMACAGVVDLYHHMRQGRRGR